MTEYTDHYGLPLPDFDTTPWHEAWYDTVRAMDALIFNALQTADTVGLWTVATIYTVGDRVIDPVGAAIYTCLVSHTSAATGTFSADRIAHPTYWEVATLVLTPRGEWAKGVLYSENDLVYQVSEGVSAICTTTHTSSNGGADTIRTDVAKWAFIIDISLGTINADDVVYDNATSGLTAADVQAAIDELVVTIAGQASGLPLKANLASPTFTGTVAVPVPAPSDDTTKPAPTNWVNDAIAAAVPAASQPLDALLTALAALVVANNQYIYFTAADTPALATITAAGRTWLAAADAAAELALLANFVGDTGAGGTKGLVPAPAAGDAAALKFLKADATWAAPSVSTAASAAEQETGTEAAKYVAPATQHRHASAAKCWAYVTVSGGVPTLAANYNITSITDTATGRLTITIATDFSSANYAVALAGMIDSSTEEVTFLESQAAGSIVLAHSNASGGYRDPTAWSFVGFGDQ